MPCNEFYASPENYTDFWCVELEGGDDEAQVERYLGRSAGTINMARRAQGACDCSLSTDSEMYLRDLSIVLAVVYHICPCAKPNLSQEQRQMYLNQATEELRMIRVGEIELCDGETGADFPAIGWAEQSLTDFATARIIAGRVMREG